ncbi:hypothetical protein BKA67DRAFT_529658 [Truncatella angustata]|uniref:NAD(P)-binding domain-containing protein n=1 Tax=Truncatella angustata TaxID=152316 RepID=A0A9P9A2K4_9PEZI|nr:uncharacterized protein BKA67DRAFT_529658 [Truncatella angustata]KAH6659507.1 hypothetical protein BKA67DRAFT_529658 [Truncatella angustata]
MTILLTGGSGLRQGPDAASHGYSTVKFDIGDESTWTEPFENTQIEAVYLMEPRISEPWVPMNKFVDLAKKQGVKRFVLCAGTSAVIGKDGMGRAWEHFIELSVDYCVLRPSWFMDEKSYNHDFRVLGPEILTYDPIAEKLSKALGRKIEHVKLDEASRINGLVQAGLSDYFARFFTRLEVSASKNSEMAIGDVVEWGDRSHSKKPREVRRREQVCLAHQLVPRWLGFE